MNKGHVKKWVDGYVKAWGTNDPADIAALFTPGATYATGPFDRPWRGRDAIVKKWLARRDTPGSWKFRYEVIAVDGNTAVVRGWTKYLKPAREFSNLWLIRLDSQGRCREFSEWWVQRR